MIAPAKPRTPQWHTRFLEMLPTIIRYARAAFRDRDPEAREELIRLNEGYASVPTLLFPDGTKLTEPSFAEIRNKLAMESPPSLANWIRNAFGQGESDD